MAALRLAALPPDGQVAALPDFVDAPDEIADAYEDAWLLVPEIREAGLLTEEQYAPLARLDGLFREMTDSSLWTAAALRHDPLWQRSRELAAEALALLGRGRAGD